MSKLTAETKGCRSRETELVGHVKKYIGLKELAWDKTALCDQRVPGLDFLIH